MGRFRVYVFPNEMRDAGLEVTKEVCAFLTENGCDVFAPSLSEVLDGVEVVDRPLSCLNLDFAISLGGDGTVLKAAEELDGSQTPLLGINLGHVGYLNQAERDNWRAVLQKLLKGDFSLQKRMRLQTTLEFLSDDGQVIERQEFKALNDVVLHRADTSGAVVLKMSIDEVVIDELKADGLIFSTPTGSTAYNLSAGGPILNPVARGFVVTPLNSHSVFSRPMVMDPCDTIMVEFEPVSYQEAPLLSVDGFKHSRLAHKARLLVTGASPDDDFAMANVSEHNFYEVLKNKFKKGVM